MAEKQSKDAQEKARPGRGWHGNPQGHAEAGKAGGSKVSEDRTHMAEIGRRGGQKVSENRQHMASIGKKGGESR